jgi:hypothetical protein
MQPDGSNCPGNGLQRGRNIIAHGAAYRPHYHGSTIPGYDSSAPSIYPSTAIAAAQNLLNNFNGGGDFLEEVIRLNAIPR